MANIGREETYGPDLSSSMIMSPKPSVQTGHANHMTGRYAFVRDTTSPDAAEITAQPSEKGSILVAGQIINV